VELVDDWYAAVLRGTGSRSLRLNQEFIPAYRTINTHECVGGPTPGSVINRAPLYRMPLFALFAHGIAGPAVGVALGALDSIVDSARSGRSRAGAALAQQQSVLVRLAEATAEIDAARGLLAAASQEAHSAAAAGALPAVPDRVRWRRNGAYAATMCMRAVQRLHPLAGAGAISEDHAFQRSLRDIHAVCAHIALTWDIQATNYGGVLLGQPSADPKL
jgi:3-hydroxy-9,10-secoandrosta-1,3,5(10)-triene-9,17-dione monooxygenase